MQNKILYILYIHEYYYLKYLIQRKKHCLIMPTRRPAGDQCLMTAGFKAESKRCQRSLVVEKALSNENWL